MEQKPLPKYHTSREFVETLKARTTEQQAMSERIASRITQYTGSMPFLLLNLLWFTLWIVVNNGWVPGIAPFDPFPFGLLTMMVSLEAIILAILVLIAQNQSERSANLREEINLQLSVVTEQELTKVLNLLTTLVDQSGVPVFNDAALEQMLQPVTMETMEKLLDMRLEHSA